MEEIGRIISKSYAIGIFGGVIDIVDGWGTMLAY